MVQRVLEGEPTNPGLRPATDFTDILSGEITSILKLASFLIPDSNRTRTIKEEVLPQLDTKYDNDQTMKPMHPCYKDTMEPNPCRA